MAKQDFEWQDNEREWKNDVEFLDAAPPPAAPKPPRRPRRLPRRIIWLTSVIVIIIVGVIAWRAQHDAQQGYAHIRSDIQATSDLEAWAWLTRNDTVKAGLMSATAAPGWRTRTVWADNRLRDWAGDGVQGAQVKLSEPELRGDLALVNATVTLTGNADDFPGYSEMRFYERQADGLWRRTNPDARFWGAERHLSSDHFQLTYQARDEEAVQAFLPQAEALYTQLARDLQIHNAFLPPLHIQIVPTTQSTTAEFNTDQRLILASPLLSPTTLGYQPQDNLLRGLAYPLINYLVQRAIERPTALSDWLPYRWHRVALGIVQWLTYSSLPMPMAGDSQLEIDFRHDLAAGSRPSLTDLLNYDNNSFATRGGTQMLQMSLAEYIAAAYGRDRLGSLLAASPDAQTWDELTHTVFNTDSATFEAAWRAYIQTRYGGRPYPQAVQ